MKNIIDALTSSYSLEGEFEVQKSINFIENIEDIERRTIRLFFLDKLEFFARVGEKAPNMAQ